MHTIILIHIHIHVRAGAGIVYSGYSVRFPWRPHIVHRQRSIHQVRRRKGHDPLRAVTGSRGIRCCRGLSDLGDRQSSSPSSTGVDI